ncbi:ATP-binding protein [Pueribacillus sp. YX66]|uniref:ATP-binding protein n=1 Tax=Pueribacillus sp. YX66 TaxID=3229242 RepID=UPI00358D4E76
MKKRIYPSLLIAFFTSINIYSISQIISAKIIPADYIVVLIGFVYLAIGIYSYRQQPYTKVMKHYLFLMFVSALAISLSVPSSLGVPLTREIEVVTVSFAPFVLLNFFEYFPRTKRPKAYKLIRFVTLIFSLVTIGLYFIYLISSFPILNSIYHFTAIINIMLSVVTCCIVLFQHLKYNSTKIRNQITILIYGIFVSFVPVLLFSLIPEYFFNLTAVPFQYSLISIIMLPITLSYLFSKHAMVHFHINIKRTILYAILFILCSLLFYVSSSRILHISLNQAVYLNVLFLFGLIVFYIGQQFIEALFRQSWNMKLQDFETEKQMIFHQFLKSKHMEQCAKLITKFIENTIEVDGVWIIWKQNEIPVSLHQTGIFTSVELTDVFEKINKEQEKNIITYPNQTFLTYPLISDHNVVGWIFIGREKGITSFSNEDIVQVKKILYDSTQLISSAQTLTHLEKHLQKNQELFNASNQFNHVLLKELENKDKFLSQFLHDEVLQYLIFLSNKIDFLHKQEQIDTKANEELKNYLKTVIHDIREMSHHLHPAIVEDLGLTLALKAMKRKLEENHNIQIELDNHLSDYRVLTKELSIQIYSIIKELVHNAIKHSSSEFISILLQEDQFSHLLKVTVEDNGVGFDIQDTFARIADSNSIGLITVQQRVNQLQGVLEIKSKPNFGTSIVITVPIEWGESNENQSIIS